MNLPALHLRHPRSERDGWNNWIPNLSAGITLIEIPRPSLGDLRGQNVYIYANGKISLIWEAENVERIPFTLCATPNSKPVKSGDKRLFQFSKDEISLADKNGKVFSGRGYDAVTWSTNRLMNLESRDKLLRMFNHHLKLSGLLPIVPVDGSESTSASGDVQASATNAHPLI